MQTSGLYWIVWLMVMTSSAYAGLMVMNSSAYAVKVTLKIKNLKEPIYNGDNVTLECSTESDLPNWTYRWNTQSSSRWWNNINVIHEDTHTLQFVMPYNSGKYWCAAVRDDHPYYFELSNPVTLTVQDKPKATLKMRRPVQIGDTVTLDCSIDGGFTGWKYSWYKWNWTGERDLLNGTTGDTYTVQSVTQSDTGVYWCAGERDGLARYSKLSNAVTLSFQEKLKATLKKRSQKELIYKIKKIKNPKVQFYTGDKVTLECRIEGGLPGWRYHWFKTWGSEWKEINGITGATYTMESVSSSDSGEYWCWAVRDDPPDYSEVSNAVTVDFKDELNVRLKLRNERKPVYIGDNVTLECSSEGNFTFGRYKWTKWNRAEGMERSYTGNTYTIQSVTQSDSGVYWCHDYFSMHHFSNIFLLTVQATEKVTLKIKNPKVQFYTGDSVTLECSSEGDLSGWTYRWYHWSQEGVWNELSHTTEYTYSLQSVAQSDGGKYWCYAFRDDPLHYTEFSNAVTLTVQADYSTGNGIRIGLSFLVLIVLLVLVSERFWIRVLSTYRTAKGDIEVHNVI